MAKLQIDKETLIKHRFWIMLGGIAFLMLLATSWLGTGVADELDGLKRAIDKHRADLKANAAKHLAGEEEKKVLDNKRKVLEGRKAIIWTEAWDLQNPPGDPLLVWPKLVEKDFAELPFGFEFDPKFVNDYVRKNSYYSQFDDGGGPGLAHGIANIFKVEVSPKKVDPTKKETVRDAIVLDPVHFKEGWQNIIRHVKEKPGWNDHPTYEEVWLAQEDYWLQRELLRALKQACYSVGHFVPVEGAGKPDTASNELGRQRFINGGGHRDNATWQVDLALVKKDTKFHLAGKITNIGRRKQGLGKIYFFVRVHRDETAKPIILEVQGEELGIGKDWPINSPALADLFRNPDGVYDLEQIFDENTSPIRRIDQIAMFRSAHRTFKSELKKSEFSKKMAGTNPTAPREDQKPEEIAEDRTENGLVRARYYDITEQVRRIPLGVDLVVDQAHIPEILTALANCPDPKVPNSMANCKLRFQTTQVNFQPFRGTLKDEKGPAGFTDPRLAALSEESSNSLMELSVYGIASLYERPPKKTDKTETEKKAE